MKTQNKSTFTTDKEIKSLKPKDKEYTLTDNHTQGLQLIIRPDGGKQWAFRYSSPILKDKNGKSKQRRKGLGTYPLVTLVEARSEALELKKDINQGIDPLELKLELKNQIIFDDKSQFHKVVYQWIDEILIPKLSPNTISQIRRAFENDIFPYFCKYDNLRNIISSKPIGGIHHSEILKTLNIKSIVSPEITDKMLGWCKRVWSFATSHGYCEYNVIVNISREILPKVKVKHYPKITDEKILGQLLRDIDNYKGSPIVRNALRLYPYTMLRAENLTALKWEYIDFEKKILTIPRNQMKVKDKNLDDFKLPLVDTAILILRDIEEITRWGNNQYVFHGVSNFNNSLNKESCNKALRVIGYNDEAAETKQTQHSFRGTFRSLVETYAHIHKASFEVKEAILDHHIGGEVERAYTHKADYTSQMRELLEWWERFLLRLKSEI